MLKQLSIQNVVLVERLDLEFEPGLGVLTGETGAGKSILLDALGLALGARADSAPGPRGPAHAGGRGAPAPRGGWPAAAGPGGWPASPPTSQTPLPPALGSRRRAWGAKGASLWSS